MTSKLSVNFHCHSIFSDGEDTPELLVEKLSAAGVRFAALTDHDTIEGLPRFQAAAEKHNIASLTGVELTTRYHQREVHLLGYGFNAQNAELSATLLSLRNNRTLEVHSIAGSMRKKGVYHAEAESATGAAPDGNLEIGQAIHLIHNAGGKVFLAHPLLGFPGLEGLEEFVRDLKDQGLDGIEAVYESYSNDQQTLLLEIANKLDLLVSAGTDLHSNKNQPKIDMPQEKWKLFRNAVFDSHSLSNSGKASESNQLGAAVAHQQHENRHRFRRRYYALRIFLPTMIAIGLFLAAIWGLILPSFEQSLLDRKRELIRELTNSALSILTSYYKEEQNGVLSTAEAQRLAASQVGVLRYGPEGKDYFWIQDMHPNMVMHPYRTELVGTDLRGFTDPRGIAIFTEFADLVRRQGEGYIDYVWQWNDDPNRLEPKESYVKGFEPWGWVIGTGLYIDDVRSEILRIERNLVNAALAISGVVILLLIYVLQQSLKIERDRQDMVDSLRKSTERYHSLVEATTEGSLLVLDHQCRYANPTFLNMTGYTLRQLEFLDLLDILPQEKENAQFWVTSTELSLEKPIEGLSFEGLLRHADGHLFECILTINPITIDGQTGLIVLTKEINRQQYLTNGESLGLTAANAPIGLFRAKVSRRAAIIEMNAAARSLFQSEEPALADLFVHPEAFSEFMISLDEGAAQSSRVLQIENNQHESIFISLSARISSAQDDSVKYIVGVIQDVTDQYKQNDAQNNLIEKLQASLLFLHQPISTLGHEVLTCDMNTSIHQLARLMTEQKTSAALVSSHGSVIGIITDNDLRARVLSENAPTAGPIHQVMSSPLHKISEDALIYEALMCMEEKGLSHLAVEDQLGNVVNVIDNKALIQFHRYGPIVLTREISRAATVEEVYQANKRIPSLVSTLLDSSARPRHVTNLLASMCDSSTERLIQLGIQALGSPPTKFAFIAMGSQGRSEQTLLTDQDNGIIYSHADHKPAQDVENYFLQLGNFVCDGLFKAGYPLCRGGVMANQPRWCRSIDDWTSGIQSSISNPEPQEIINLSIFFDFRTVFGDVDLTQELRNGLYAALDNQPSFIPHFAQNSLLFKPPFRLVGNIYLNSGSIDRTGEINLKDAMMPIVSFARLYALQHHINQTHTLERIEALSEIGIIQPASRDEMITAYDFLMQLRLQNQAECIQAGKPLTNGINPGKLGYIQQELLKQAFAQISAVQKRVSYDFLGGTL